MFEQYLEELQKEAAAMDEQEALYNQLKNLPVTDLAKIAGIELPESLCPVCASTMEKMGSVMHCTCGMMKKAKELPPALAENAAKAKAVQDPKKPGAEVPAGLKKSAQETKPGFVEGSVGAARALGPAGILGPMAAGMGTAGASAGLGALIAKALKKSPGAGALLGAAPGFLGGMGVQEALMRKGLREKGVKREFGGPLGLGSPEYTFSPEAKKKYLKKSASAVLEKLAVNPLTGEDLQEAIEEAQERESIPVTSRRWGAGGAAAGGLGGGALGYGAGRLLAGLAEKKAPGVAKALPAALTALGIGGGALGGGILGAKAGAREAAAEKILSALRAQQAAQSGARRGYVAGARRGYVAGRRGF